MAKKRKSPPDQPQARQQQHEEDEKDDVDATSSYSSSEEEDVNEAGDSSNREALRKLLEPFNKEQLIALIKEETLNDPSMYGHITRFADSDPAHRKIFVHGLARETTQPQILQAFQTFGEIEECKLITDKVTGQAKGYAFVLFKTRSAAKAALKDPQKKIGSRSVNCQLSSVGPVATASADVSARKIYVGNVGPNIDVESLRAFFEKFGEIEEGPFGFDSVTNKSKGFAIFVYKTAQGCKNALEEPAKMFGGCKLYCKKFIENNSNNNSGSNHSNKSQLGQVFGDDNYGTQGIMSSNMNLGPLLMAQNQGLGFAGNPMMASVMNPTGFVAPGLSANYGIHGISPGFMGGYNSQGMLQGLAAYQNAQFMGGQSSSGGATPVTSAGATGSQSSIGPTGTKFPSFGR